MAEFVISIFAKILPRRSIHHVGVASGYDEMEDTTLTDFFKFRPVTLRPAPLIAALFVPIVIELIDTHLGCHKRVDRKVSISDAAQSTATRDRKKDLPFESKIFDTGTSFASNSTPAAGDLTEVSVRDSLTLSSSCSIGKYSRLISWWLGDGCQPLVGGFILLLYVILWYLFYVFGARSSFGSSKNVVVFVSFSFFLFFSELTSFVEIPIPC